MGEQLACRRLLNGLIIQWEYTKRGTWNYGVAFTNNPNILVTIDIIDGTYFGSATSIGTASCKLNYINIQGQGSDTLYGMALAIGY